MKKVLIALALIAAVMLIARRPAQAIDIPVPEVPGDPEPWPWQVGVRFEYQGVFPPGYPNDGAWRTYEITRDIGLGQYPTGSPYYEYWEITGPAPSGRTQLWQIAKSFLDSMESAGRTRRI